MSNGYGVWVKKDDQSFWKFVRDNEIVWHITTYGVSARAYRELFEKNGCIDLLSLDESNRFGNLVVLTEEEQEISGRKYKWCGWERLNIFVRNGKIWKCPTAEYIDLFNGYFKKDFKISLDS